jgi:hypothetical protein
MESDELSRASYVEITSYHEDIEDVVTEKRPYVQYYDREPESVISGMILLFVLLMVSIIAGHEVIVRFINN